MILCILAAEGAVKCREFKIEGQEKGSSRHGCHQICLVKWGLISSEQEIFL